MKRIPILALACCLVVSSCGASESAGDGTLKMGIAVANISLNFAHEMVEGAQLAAENEGGVSFKAVGPPNTDGPAEQQLFTNLTTTNPDGVVLENLDPPIFTRPAAQAVDKGVPVVALDTAPTDGSKITFYVGNDNYNLGVMLADELLKRLPPQPNGSVVVGVPNPGTPVLDSRAKGIKDTLNQKAPGIKVLGPFQTYSDPNQNYGAWAALVHANASALAFLGVGDADSYDLAKIKQTENGQYLVAGADVDAKTLQGVKSGLDFVTIDPEHFLKGYVVTALLIRSVKQKKPLPKGWLNMPGLVVDSSNIDAVLQRQTSPKAAYEFYKPEIDKILADPNAYLKPMSDAR
ncbi:sugar ABC transporter substrate-binding protein [Actinocrispum wychmicini]|uniref:Ribose transport system substrate-binding protein n=1 Tax=Actinocrispum wychmicini TaxID=1213861 RepID=A0A4R2JKW1_9PSEU|nr:sugar ABC transporter substrate-binding protein [Actinocrispum wychmicini]TCO54815.1 ribose transport system substrate-binding protein [Actinocrispum wychmicini]